MGPAELHRQLRTLNPVKAPDPVLPPSCKSGSRSRPTPLPRAPGGVNSPPDRHKPRRGSSPAQHSPAAAASTRPHGGARWGRSEMHRHTEDGSGGGSRASRDLDSQLETYCLGSIVGPLTFGNPHIYTHIMSLRRHNHTHQTTLKP